MARIRTIKPEFFSDERINSLDISARFLTIGLISRADDRGRQQRLPLAILGYVFPAGDVTPEQLSEWLTAIIEARIVHPYEVDGHPYLWLPHFWRHQRINRPSESTLPPHPDDPYGDLPIEEALQCFRGETDSLSDHGGLTEPSSPRARACAGGRASLPFPSSSTTKAKGNRPGGKQTKALDQDELPEDVPDRLRSTAAEVLVVLARLERERGGNVPRLRGVGLVLLRFPDRPHLDVVRELEYWATAGRGQQRAIKDWVRTYSTFLERTPAGTPTRAAGQDPDAMVAALNRRYRKAP